MLRISARVKKMCITTCVRKRKIYGVARTLVLSRLVKLREKGNSAHLSRMSITNSLVLLSSRRDFSNRGTPAKVVTFRRNIIG